MNNKKTHQDHTKCIDTLACTVNIQKFEQMVELALKSKILSETMARLKAYGVHKDLGRSQ